MWNTITTWLPTSTLKPRSGGIGQKNRYVPQITAKWKDNLRPRAGFYSTEFGTSVNVEYLLQAVQWVIQRPVSYQSHSIWKISCGIQWSQSGRTLVVKMHHALRNLLVCIPVRKSICLLGRGCWFSIRILFRPSKSFTIIGKAFLSWRNR